MKKIAVTGGLSSGKSEVCRIFKKFGAFVLSADEIGRDILANNPETIKTIQQAFGPDILTSGKLDRKKLANKVFNDVSKLRKIEQILHPQIAERIEKETSGRRQPFCVVEVPLLFEAKWESKYDKIIAVVAPDDQTRERSVTRGFDYDARMQHQLPQSEKANRADFVITNDGSLDNLEFQVEKIIEQLNNEG